MGSSISDKVTGGAVAGSEIYDLELMEDDLVPMEDDLVSCFIYS